MWKAHPKEQAEGDPEGSMVLPNISTIANYNLFDFLKDLLVLHKELYYLILLMRASQVH